MRRRTLSLNRTRNETLFLRMFLAAAASVVVLASAGFHGTHLHQSIVSPGGHHAHANTHYVKVPVVGHEIVKQPVVTYVPKAVPILKVGVKPVHTITSIREEPLVVFNNPIPSLVTGPGVSLVEGRGLGAGLNRGLRGLTLNDGHGGHGWW
ncbi:uncharacterized protein LOC111248826 isoform X2 [Varroa destructor]|uniref:Uncharacterized protein n=1 Tax=Varroa destructor TaxID=109461 RepID=A0A7M7JVJ0_VARDE|nr:uncharacterized protein LOC111248826 isoform X2 [Varroa destructor]